MTISISIETILKNNLWKKVGGILIPEISLEELNTPEIKSRLGLCQFVTIYPHSFGCSNPNINYKNECEFSLNFELEYTCFNPLKKYRLRK